MNQERQYKVVYVEGRRGEACQKSGAFLWDGKLQVAFTTSATNIKNWEKEGRFNLGPETTPVASTDVTPYLKNTPSPPDTGFQRHWG